MWQALILALLDWLVALAKSRRGAAGEDAPPQPGLRDRLNKRLDAWKAGRQ